MLKEYYCILDNLLKCKEAIKYNIINNVEFALGYKPVMVVLFDNNVKFKINETLNDEQIEEIELRTNSQLKGDSTFELL